MKPFSLNVKGQLLKFKKPLVMGIVNITDDSFFAPSRMTAEHQIRNRIDEILQEGADIIDVGGCSTRPGAAFASYEYEKERLRFFFDIYKNYTGDSRLISVDTFRTDIAKMAVEEYGADIINDISGGDLDKAMVEFIAKSKTIYVATHNKILPDAHIYNDYDYTPEGGVTASVIRDLSEKLSRFQLMGIGDVIVDPGFGFAKNSEQNFELLRNLELIITTLGAPLLVGLSRKRMVFESLGTSPSKALNGTTSLNTLALAAGTSILRVHDVKAAKEAIELYNCYQGS